MMIQVLLPQLVPNFNKAADGRRNRRTVMTICGCPEATHSPTAETGIFVPIW